MWEEGEEAEGAQNLKHLFNCLMDEPPKLERFSTTLVLCSSHSFGLYQR